MLSVIHAQDVRITPLTESFAPCRLPSYIIHCRFVFAVSVPRSRLSLKVKQTILRFRSTIDAVFQFIQTLPARIPLSDLLIPFYLAVFVRQYFWVIENNFVAWGLTAFVSLILWAFYVSSKDPEGPKTHWLFWLIVGVPLLAVFALRVGFPDRSFDVIYYHIFHSERMLAGKLYVAGDFAPCYYPFLNPAPDMLTGIFRRLLGYRLGTILNYFVLLWTGIILNKMLRQYIQRPGLRALAVLMALASEQFFFEINTYLVDLLALPLFLEALYRTLWRPEAKFNSKNFVFISLLMGACVGLKLTNLFFIIPIFAMALYRFAASKQQRRLLTSWRMLSGAALAFLAPLLPHASYLYWLTRSPVFPQYNAVFKSPLFPAENIFDLRFGPQTFWETVLWPVLAVFKPEQTSELGVYSGRISLAFIGSILFLLIARGDQRLRLLGMGVIGSSILWSLIRGYTRYALPLELLSGVMLVGSIAHLLNSKTRPMYGCRLALSCLLLFAFLAQDIAAAKYIFRYGWGDQATVFQNRIGYAIEARNLLKDRSFSSYLSP